MANQTTKIQLQAEISASSNGLISALKQASGAINDTTQSWSSKFSQLKDSTSLISQSVKNLGDLVKKVGDVDMDVNGVEQVSSAILDVSKTFESVQREVSSFTAQLVQMKNAASELGMPVNEYQRFADAVKASGMSLEEGHTLIKNMQHSILDLANGVPEAKDSFAKLGLSIEQLSSNTATANFDAIVQALQSIVQPTEQAKASMELFKTSMEHAVNVSQEYNKLLVEQTNNAYATDKDVQNSISLASAVEKLGEQLGMYANGLGNVSNESKNASQASEELFQKLKASNDLYTNLYVSYESFVDALKKGVVSTLDSTKAVNAYYHEVYLLRQEYETFKKYMNETGEEPPQDLADSLKKRFGDALDYFRLVKEKFKDETTAIEAIFKQKILAGAPIDMEEFEAASARLQTFYDIMSSLWEFGADKSVKLPFSTEDENMLRQFYSDLKDIKSAFDEISNSAAELNVQRALEDGTDAFVEFREQLNEAMQLAKQGLDFNIDVRPLEEYIEKLEKLRDSKSMTMAGATTLDDTIMHLEEWMNRASNLRYEFDKNWFEKAYDGAKAFGKALSHPLQTIRDMGQALKNLGGNAISKAKSGFSSLANFVRHPVSGIRQMKQAMDDFVASTHSAKNAMQGMGASTKSQAQQIAGQLFGMGSKVAIIVKGFRTIGTAIKMYVIDPLTKAGEEMRKFQEYLTKGQISSAENTIKRYTQMEEDLKKYAETLKKLGQTGKESDRVSAEKQQKMINAQYGLDVNPQNINEVMEKQFGVSLKQREAAIRSQIKAYEKLNEALEEEYKDKDSYVKNDLFRSLEEKFRGKERMVEIRREQGENNEKIFELRNQLRMMGFEDNLGDWKKEQTAEQTDKDAEEAKKKAEELKKKEEEAEKKLEEGLKKLKDWSNSISDSEHLKNLRAIWQKYAEAVNSGVSENRARNVAIQAISDMLRKEKEAEEKQHEEMVKAMEERVKQYKTAFQAYADAHKAVVDAEKEYARTQRDLAKENRAERIAKRRERLAKRMSSFGFSPFEGFNMNETHSERRERRRNAQIDASISEKMGKAQAGGRVHWTPAEKERLAQFEKLQKKDKQLEAAQKQMEAADKQQKAADALKDAAKAIKDAQQGRGDALKEVGKAVGDMLNNSLPKLNKRYKTDKEAREVFENAGLTLNGFEPYAKGMNTDLSQQVNYNGQLEAIHKDLQDLNKRVFVVK